MTNFGFDLKRTWVLKKGSAVVLNGSGLGPEAIPCP